jgi:hypothetical protein
MRGLYSRYHSKNIPIGSLSYGIYDNINWVSFTFARTLITLPFYIVHNHEFYKLEQKQNVTKQDVILIMLIFGLMEWFYMTLGINADYLH